MLDQLFFSTEVAFFPLQLKNFKDRYFVGSLNTSSFLEIILDEKKLIEAFELLELSQIKPGDEVLAVNKIPLQKVIERILNEELGGNHSATGYALAEKMLFLRRGEYGENIPEGCFQLTVRHKDEVRESTYEFPWIYTNEFIKNDSLQLQQVSLKTLDTSFSRVLSKNCITIFAKDLLCNKDSHQLKKKMRTKDLLNQVDLRKKSFLPPLGKILWETGLNSNTYGYLCEISSGYRIGYLYIEDFINSNALRDIIDVLKYFNTHSDALVIDVTDNPGGSLFYMYTILAMLTDQPLRALPTQEKLIQEDIYQFFLLHRQINKSFESRAKITEVLNGYPIDELSIQKMSDYAEEVISLWDRGQLMTPPICPFGINEINPHPDSDIRYTKPITVLINELNFSCGELFPAILQGNNRAVLFGKTTAGAGGFVKPYSYINIFGIKECFLTSSIIYQLNGIPIENKGVEPNISYEITIRDFEENYIDYINNLNNLISEQIRKNE